MLNLEYLKQLLVVSVALSSITCIFIQKTKKHFKKSKFITLYSFAVNMLIGYLFCMSFTSISFPISLWVGLFSFLGADTIFKTLEGKLASYTDIVSNEYISVKKANLIETEDK